MTDDERVAREIVGDKLYEKAVEHGFTAERILHVYHEEDRDQEKIREQLSKALDQLSEFLELVEEHIRVNRKINKELENLRISVIQDFITGDIEPGKIPEIEEDKE